MATAIREALKEAADYLRSDGRMFAERHENWFLVWCDRLNHGLRNAEETEWLFHFTSPIDVVKLTSLTDDQWWPEFKPVLLRWAEEQQIIKKIEGIDISKFPPRLDEYLASRLLGLTRKHLFQVLRDKEFDGGWKACQQQFLLAIAKQTQASNSSVAAGFRELANRQEEMKSYLEAGFDRLISGQSEIKDKLVGIQNSLDQIGSRVSRYRPAPPPLDPYATVQPLSQNHIERRELLAPLRRLLLGGRRAGALMALHGMAGIGKTALARALCHDPRVRKAFPDGIVWIDIGRESRSSLLDRMRKIAWALNQDSSFYSQDNCEAYYHTLLASRAVLIVLDDVWSANDVKPFLTDSPNCRVLFTAQDAAVGATPELGAQGFGVERLSEEQSRELLARSAGCKPDQMPDAAEDIIRECGHSPNALSEIGSSLRGKPDKMWLRRLLALKNAEVEAVFAPTKVSVDALEDDQLERRYLQLAFLLEDMSADATILRTIWNVDEEEAEKTTEVFVERSLATRENGGIRLHDLQLDFVRSVYADRDALAVIHGALRLSAHVWQSDPLQFASQMLGRLLSYSSDQHVHEFLSLVEKGAPRPWLRPHKPSLAPPGGTLLRVLAGHTDAVRAVAISPDGKWAVSASDDRTLKVWNLETGSELQSLSGHTHHVVAVAISPDGKRAVSASWDMTLKVWNLATGRELHTLSGHATGVSTVAISPDGKWAVSASSDKTLKVWNLETGRELQTLYGHAEVIQAVAISQDSKRAASASWDKTLKVWNLETGRELHTLSGHTSIVAAVAISPDGKRAVSASVDKTLKVWNLETGRELQTLYGHADGVSTVAISPDGKRAVSSSWDGTLKVWNLETGSELQTLYGHTDAVRAVAISPDGKKAVSASEDSTLKVWNLETGRELHTLSGYSGRVIAVAISPDGKRAVSAAEGKTVKVWNLETGSKLDTLSGHAERVKAVAISPDGKKAVSAYEDSTLKVWNLETGRELHTLSGHTDEVTAMAISPDGKRAVSASWDMTLKVWNLETGSELYTLSGHTHHVMAVAISPDGKRAVSASWDMTLKVWNLETGSELDTLSGHTERVMVVAISSDGKKAVSASWDMTLKVWNLETGSELHTLFGHTDWVTAVAISPDGKWAVSASDDRTLKVWNLETGSELHTLSGHTGQVIAVAISPDGKWAVSASVDSALKVWDLETGNELRTLSGHIQGVRAVAVSPDGKRAVSASWDRTLKVWNVETGGCLCSFTCDAPVLCCAVGRYDFVIGGDLAGQIHILSLELPTI